jgi:hypothetical protein
VHKSSQLEVTPRGEEDNAECYSQLYSVFSVHLLGSFHRPERRRIVHQRRPAMSLCQQRKEIVSNKVQMLKQLQYAFSIDASSFTIYRKTWPGVRRSSRGNGQPLTRDNMHIGIAAVSVIVGVYATLKK